MLKPREYLEKLNITIDDNVEKYIRTAWDLDCVLDAVFIFDDYHVTLNMFAEAQKVCHDYFNGNLDGTEYENLDFAYSLTAQYWHYTKEDKDDALIINPDKILVEVDLQDESRWYELN